MTTPIKLPQLRKVGPQVLEAVREYQTQNPRPVSPCIDQTEHDISAYYKSAGAGNQAVVRQTQGHILLYTVTAVEGTNPKAGRVYIQGFGAFYAKSGKNCFHPKGQTTLVVPTAEVLEWAAAHPRGESDISCWRSV